MLTECERTIGLRTCGGLSKASAAENSQNRNMYKNNKLKEQFITMSTVNCYRFMREINCVKYTRYFKTLEEAIVHRNTYNAETGLSHA